MESHECGGGRCLCALDAFGMVVGDLGVATGQRERLVEAAGRPCHRTDPHGRAVAIAAVGLGTGRGKPTAETSTIPCMGVAGAQLAHALHQRVRPTTGEPQHVGHSHHSVVGGVGTFGEQQETLGFDRIEFVHAAYHIATHCTQAAKMPCFRP